jgi:hypothetical protein
MGLTGDNGEVSGNVSVSLVKYESQGKHRGLIRTVGLSSPVTQDDRDSTIIGCQMVWKSACRNHDYYGTAKRLIHLTVWLHVDGGLINFVLRVSPLSLFLSAKPIGPAKYTSARSQRLFHRRPRFEPLLISSALLGRGRNMLMLGCLLCELLESGTNWRNAQRGRW